MSGHNPYEAPKTDVSLDPSEQQGADLPAAGRGARFLNFLIDGIITRFGLTMILGGVVAAMGPERTGLLTLPLLLAGMIGYYIVLEAAFGWTLGKLITGTRVVNAAGHLPSLGQALLRVVGTFMSLATP